MASMLDLEQRIEHLEKSLDLQIQINQAILNQIGYSTPLAETLTPTRPEPTIEEEPITDPDA